MEDPIGSFSQDYREARAKFLASAKSAANDVEIRIETFDNPAPGPDGFPVHTDVALIGNVNAPNALVLNSATHGVEGFCGSAILIDWLRRGEAAALPSNLRAILIHAINPHGFAWLRRVTEDNVDLNRNFGNHEHSYPKNTEYSALHETLVPKLWNKKSLAACKLMVEDYVAEHGEFALQAVITRGQYDHPDGLFYAGQGPSWSNITFHKILNRFIKGAKAVAFMDFHTGLGPYGFGSLLGGSHVKNRMQEWFGDERSASPPGKSLSAPLGGVIGGALRTACANADITSVTVEFGTYPVLDVIEALRADNWLHLHGNPDSKIGRAIKLDIRKRLYPDEDDWKEMVLLRSRHILRRATNGLNRIE